MVACGLLSSLGATSQAGTWIGYQILAGVGSGSAYQAPFIAIQSAVDMKDVPVSNAIAGLFNAMGAAIGISIAQNIFINILKKDLRANPEIDVAAIVQAGASDVRKITPQQLLELVLLAYNTAVTRTFLFDVAAAGVALLCALPLGLKSLKPKNPAIEAPS